jgi:SAM-dependent methyltransferase
VPNAAQAERWGGAGGQHWIDFEAGYDRQLEPFGVALLDAAALRPDQRVLDVGCGTGTALLTGADTAGFVLGVDISPRLVARAQVRAAGRTNVEVRVADAQTATFEPAFDVIISRFGLMFFDDPRAAFANLRGALLPEGRLVAICWQALDRNDWMRIPGEALSTVVPLGDLAEPDQPGPFSLADPAEVEAILTDAGWHDTRLDPVEAPVLLSGGGSLEDAVGFVRRGSLGRSALGGVASDVEATALAAVRDALAPFQTSRGVELAGAAWLVHTHAGSGTRRPHR